MKFPPQNAKPRPHFSAAPSRIQSKIRSKPTPSKARKAPPGSHQPAWQAWQADQGKAAKVKTGKGREGKGRAGRGREARSAGIRSEQRSVCGEGQSGHDPCNLPRPRTGPPFFRHPSYPPCPLPPWGVPHPPGPRAPTTPPPGLLDCPPSAPRGRSYTEITQKSLNPLRPNGFHLMPY